MAENVGALHPGGPDHKFGRNEAPIGKLYAVCANLSRFRFRPYIHSEALQKLGCGIGYPRWQCGQDSIGSLD